MKFLVLQHVEHEHPGLIANYAEDKGIKLDVVELWKPYKIPTISDYNALLIMGGPMGVYEDRKAYPSKEDELRIIKGAIRKKVPTLGICLGSQLLAHALDARVYPNMVQDRRVKEIGYYNNVDLTQDGLSSLILKGFQSPLKVLQWHGDVFDLPRGATLLARSPVCNQAFSYGNAYAFLFHFEFTPEMVARLIEIDRDWIHKDHEIDEEQLLKEAEINSGLMRQQSARLLDNFVSIIES